MASKRFSGVIGFGESVESPVGSGVWIDQITERKYRGDIVRMSRSLEGAGEKVNADISIGNSFSIVADPFISEHIFAMRYIYWGGVRWTTQKVVVDERRLIITPGDVYNGELPVATEPEVP